MSPTDAVQRVAFSPERFEELDGPQAFIGLAVGVDGETCRRCEGKGWFQWHGVMRWCCPSCSAAHVDVDLLQRSL